MHCTPANAQHSRCRRRRRRRQIARIVATHLPIFFYRPQLASIHNIRRF